MSDQYLGAFGDKRLRRAPCPECEKDTRVTTLFQRIDHWDAHGGEVSGVNEYYVFQCKGCEAIFFARSFGNSEDYHQFFDQQLGEMIIEHIDHKTFFPTAPTTPSPSWTGFKLAEVDETLHELVGNIYGAMNAEMPILAAIAIRTAFDRISELLGVPINASFSDKLELLRKNGQISGIQKGLLEILVDAGSAAAHRGWKPEKKHLATMVEVLEGLIRDHFILTDTIKELKADIPKRVKK